MNTQQAFNFIIAHLRKQKDRAVSKTGACVYTTPEGTSCAVGCLIQDIKLSDKQNTCASAELIRENPEVQSRLEDIDTRFLANMQTLHDRQSYYGKKGFTSRGEREIKRIANLFDLSLPEQS
ncbi:MAG TPA: hypothetical protein EYN66_11915 [Myxococcales bacterium]|nr:hypothetical protein [Myxococcales bacterium]